jgi:A/G-specific adenine glycosylase
MMNYIRHMKAVPPFKMVRRERTLSFGHRTIVARRIQLFRAILTKWWAISHRRFPWRRSRISNYQRIISEMLLQRTTAAAVASFWPVFIARFPNWNALAAASLPELELCLRPLGLSKQRAPRMLALARLLASRKGRFPMNRQEIEMLPGVGQYIGNAIMLFCHKIPSPLLDVNMARVLERFFGPRKLADIRYDPYLQSLADAVVESDSNGNANWMILDFGAMICKARAPSCSECPLCRHCEYFREMASAHLRRNYPTV